MISCEHYPPLNDNDFAVWLQNFSSHLNTCAAKYEITEAECLLLQQASDCFGYWNNACHNLREELQYTIDFKNELRTGIKTGIAATRPPEGVLFSSAPAQTPSGITQLVRNIAARIKKHSAYSPADGKLLQIEGEEQLESYYTLKPVLKVELKNGHPELIWKNAGTDAVKIIVLRFKQGSSPQAPVSNDLFQFLAIDTQSGYIDRHPLPATGETAIWAYVIIYMAGPEEVGKWSDVAFVNVHGPDESDNLSLIK